MLEIHKFVCSLSINLSLSLKKGNTCKCFSMPFRILFYFRKWSNSEGQSEASLHPKDPAILAETEDVSMSRVMQAKTCM